MMSDGALLSLIIDDERALLVLAAWGGLALSLDSIDDPSTIERVAAVSGVSTMIAKQKLGTLRVARVIVDGGISEMADKMLQTLVQSKLGTKKK